MNISSGAIRSGKTYIANVRFLQFLEREAEPRTDVLIAGKKGDSVERNVIADLLKLAEEGGVAGLKYTRNPRRLIYEPKGITCYCEGANDEGAEPRIRGMTIQAFYGDEVTLYPKTFLMQVFGRCSAGKRIKFMTCNPDNPSHWFKTEVIDRISKGELNGKTWFFGLNDNPNLAPEYKEQISKLYTGVFYDRFILGKWVSAEGQVYDRFSRTEHLKEPPAEGIKEWILGIDWGYTNPLAIGLIAVDYDDRYYVADEIYVRQQNIDQSLVDLIKSKGWYDKKPSWAYADPARPDYINLFYKLTGIRCLPAANSVVEGIQAVQRRLVKRGDGTYGIYFSPTKCPNHIREHENYRWKQAKGGVEKDEPVKEDDHTPDDIRYPVFTRDRARVRPIQVK